MLSNELNIVSVFRKTGFSVSNVSQNKYYRKELYPLCFTVLVFATNLQMNH